MLTRWPAPARPSNLLQLTGGYNATRHRTRLAAPKSGRPIGNPPGHLADDEAAAWCEFVSRPGLAPARHEEHERHHAALTSGPYSRYPRPLGSRAASPR